MHKIVVCIFMFVVIATFIYCGNQKKVVDTNPYKDSPYSNLRDTSVKYVGMKTCMTCHSNIHATFMHTGMGESFNTATRTKSKAKFDAHVIVYDAAKDFYYKPYWKQDSLWILEFRLNGKDTIYKREEKISYIVGSGQHTNSHIWKTNGYLYQAPITFYTQQGIWDLAPGFEAGASSRWNRIISVECMNCHNMYPDFNSVAENKFISVKTGIECERCHGPGEAHVNAKMKGDVIDTSKFIDYTIVNPKKLPRDLQVELCQRCHLQGITVLNDGKTYFDFKPGMYLSDVMNVFMPRYEGNQNKFIMASHADRMKQSECYKNSNMTCLTCHNPHVSVKETADAIFNSKCISCHSSNNSTNKKCTEKLEVRNKVDDNCFSCHMQVSSTLDIPHVTVHDHKIQVLKKNGDTSALKFTHLECMTAKNPSPLIMAQGYLTTFESFSPQPFLLDSAKYYLNKLTVENLEKTKAYIRYYYLKNDFVNVVAESKKISNQNISDAWTNYRIGEGYYEMGIFSEALNYFNKAVVIMPEQLDFLNQQAKTLLNMQRTDEAKSVFEKILQLNPQFENAISNLAFVYMLKNDPNYSGVLIEKALALNPDSEDALMNKVALKISVKKNAEAIELLKRVLKINPQNKKAQLALETILKS